MKTAKLTGIRRFEIREVPDPKIVRDDDVLVRVATVGVCGSDVHYFTDGRIGAQVVEFPFTVGHEAAGTVERVGRAVRRVKPGDRVAIDPTDFCGECDQCRAGRPNTCRRLKFLGCPGQLKGALSELLVLPEHCCFPIAPSMTFEQATLSEPLGIAVYSVERTFPGPGATVGILGQGPVGLSVFHVLRASGVGNVYATDKIPERLAIAGELKPAWSGRPDSPDAVGEILSREPLGLDVVYECSGDPAAWLQGARLCRPGGRLVIVGIPEVDEIALPVHELRRNEVTLYNIRRQAGCTQKALDLIDSKKVNVDSLVTHRFPLERTQEAFALAAGYKNGVVKAMIEVAP
ncbi:MAG: alcohol dehydrogenase catalytic domain-containing protein [Spirochaetales bacterium]|nr:alcohol dehydrogenase catalytic domain-containing protein [Spirochaetales bacterium]